MCISHRHFAHCLDLFPILFHLIISLISPKQHRVTLLVHIYIYMCEIRCTPCRTQPIEQPSTVKNHIRLYAIYVHGKGRQFLWYNEYTIIYFPF